jgi:benzoyl-CoA-dihydrodiol lyase
VNRIPLDTHPDRYRHWKLEIEGRVATLRLDVRDEETYRPGYELKLNSYDLGVDIELPTRSSGCASSTPRCRSVEVTSATERVFCAGANIFMLGSSDHPFKVNFCKFTNETRLGLEDAVVVSGQRHRSRP